MSDTASDLIEIIEQLANAELFQKACVVCEGSGWYFGNRSNDDHAMPFWKMDLDGDPVYDAIWQAAKPHCEKLAGRPLRVVRQYANGHTYGLGGQPHRDDDREGTYTLLYYPMAEWKPEWQGETMFHDEASGEIELSVMPRPNRAVFFDARIPHAGRAPSRSCPALRVTVAYKLEAADREIAPSPPVNITEVKRDRAHRTYLIHAAAAHVSALIEERLQALSKNLRVPGYRPGKIPMDFLITRYGAKTRGEIISQLAAQASDVLLKNGNLTASLQLISGNDTGDVEIHLGVTHLPDLPEADTAHWVLERLIASDEVCRAASISTTDAASLLEQDLHTRVLDQLNAFYQFPVAPPLIERELQAILPGDDDIGEELSEFRQIAERRVKLGAVLLELARRHRIKPSDSHTVENQVITWLLSMGNTSTRPITADELREMAVSAMWHLQG